MITRMIIWITDAWIRVLRLTIDNLEPSKDLRDEVKAKMGELKNNVDTIKTLKKQHNI